MNRNSELWNAMQDLITAWSHGEVSAYTFEFRLQKAIDKMQSTPEEVREAWKTVRKATGLNLYVYGHVPETVASGD